MNHPIGAGTPAAAPEHARGLQVRLYREIGIAAVTAALRFTTQPDPAPRMMTKPVAPTPAAKSIAA